MRCVSQPAARGQMAQRRASHAQENPVTAIDIALEPDATMAERAHADNARLLKVFPKGFALNATRHAHITMLQQFVRTADLDKVYAAAVQAALLSIRDSARPPE
jgi:hypothetical protein